MVEGKGSALEYNDLDHYWDINTRPTSGSVCKARKEVYSHCVVVHNINLLLPSRRYEDGKAPITCEKTYA